MKMKIEKIIIHLDNSNYVSAQYVHDRTTEVHFYQSKVRKSLFYINLSNPSTIYLSKFVQEIIEFFKNIGCPVDSFPHRTDYFIISDDTLFSLKLRGICKNDQLILWLE